MFEKLGNDFKSLAPEWQRKWFPAAAG